MIAAHGVGIVVIGRNEGERLVRCLESCLREGLPAVYVDSGSTDESVASAKARGVDVVALDMRLPFTAARARNAGFDRLRLIADDVAFVQFVDGDCELSPGWLDEAIAYLQANADVGVVCGRLREARADSSVYNLLCDIEWDTPVGDARACGGIMMARAEAFIVVGGFRADLIAGEEPELCVRLRAAGWRIVRLDAEMARHDAAMTRFGQWWRRTKRAGYAFAEGASLHGAPPERHWVRECRSAWLWGILLPLGTILCSVLIGERALLLLLAYPLQVLRIFLRGHRTPRENLLRACFLVLGKFPEAQGQLAFLGDRFLRRRSLLIEYK